MATAFLWCRKAPAGERVAPLLQVKAGEVESFSFGRDPKSNVALKWDGISRSHSQIIHLPPDEKRLASMWLIQGKEGGNGTFVNGKRISGRQQLKEGDIVGFGHGHDIQVGCSVDPVALVYEFEFQYRTEITGSKNNNENAEPNQACGMKQDHEAMIKPSKDAKDAKNIAKPSPRRKPSSSDRKVLGHVASSPSRAAATKLSPRMPVGVGAPKMSPLHQVCGREMGVVEAKETKPVCTSSKRQAALGGSRSPPKRAAGSQKKDEWPMHLGAESVKLSLASKLEAPLVCELPSSKTKRQDTCAAKIDEKQSAEPGSSGGAASELVERLKLEREELVARIEKLEKEKEKEKEGDEKWRLEREGLLAKIGKLEKEKEGDEKWRLEREGLLAKIEKLEKKREDMAAEMERVMALFAKEESKYEEREREYEEREEEREREYKEREEEREREYKEREEEREREYKEREEERERAGLELASAAEKEREVAKAASLEYSEEKGRWEEERCVMELKMQDLSNELKAAVEEAEEAKKLARAAANQDGNGVSQELTVVMEEMRALRSGLEAEMRQVREKGEEERVKLEMQIERERADFERERMDLEAIAEKRAAQARMMLQEEAKREVSKLTRDLAKAKEEMTAARNERNSVLSRAEALAKDKSVSRAREESRIKALSDQVSKLKEAKDIIESERDEAVAALQNHKDAMAKLKARNSGLSSQVEALHQGRDRRTVSSPAGTPAKKERHAVSSSPSGTPAKKERHAISSPPAGTPAKKAVARGVLIAGSPCGSSGLKVVKGEVEELIGRKRSLELECSALEESKLAIAVECEALRINLAELDAAAKDANDSATVKNMDAGAVDESCVAQGQECGRGSDVEWGVVAEGDDKKISSESVGVSRECSIASMGEIEALEEAKSSLEERCKTLECCNKGLEGRIAALDLRYRALLEGHDASEKRCKALDEKGGQLEQQLMELRGDKVRLEQSLGALEHDKAMLSESVACHKETCAKLRASHEEEKDALIKHGQQLTLQMESMEADIESLRERMAYSDEQGEAASKQVDQVRREMEAAVEASSMYKVELEVGAAERQALMHDRDALKDSLAKMENERDLLSSRLIKASASIAELNKTVEELKSKKSAKSDMSRPTDTSIVADLDSTQPAGEGEGAVPSSQSLSQHDGAVLKPKTPPQAKDSSCRPSPRPSPSHLPAPHGKGFEQQQQQQQQQQHEAEAEAESDCGINECSDATRVLNGHADSVNAVCMVTGNGGEGMLASASSDCTVRLWKVTGVESDMEQVMKLEAKSRVWCVAGSCDAPIVACGTHDGVVHVWSTCDGSLEASLKGHQGEVRSVALSHDGTIAASGAVDKKLILWRRDPSSGGWVMASEGVGGHSGCVAALSFEGGESSLGRVASGSYDRTVRVWKVEKGGRHDVSEAVKLSGHTHWVMGVCWVGDGPEAMVASASYDRTARLWNATSGECLRVMREHSDRVTSIAFSVQSQMLSTSSFDRSTKLWSLETSHHQAQPQSSRRTLQHPAEVRSACFFCRPGDDIIATACSDKVVRLWANSK